MSFLSKVKDAVVQRFMSGLRPDAMLIENPTEEIEDAIARKRPLRLFGTSAGARIRGQVMGLRNYGERGKARDDKNYLFSTRRYPSAQNNAIGAGAIPAGQYRFFSVAIGQDGASAGFPPGFEYSTPETNLDIPAQVPQGKGFILFQEGVSFNAEALKADIAQVLDSGALRYETQGAQFGIRKGPLLFWPGGQGIAGFSDIQGNESAHNGVADPNAVRNLGRMPRVIRPLQNFAYIHEVPRGTKATDGTPWALSNFVEARVWMWGEQVDKIPE